MRHRRVMRFYQPFPAAIPLHRVGYPRVTHPSATKVSSSKLSLTPVLLACVKHAASVHPEPGSNSHVEMFNPVKKSGLLTVNLLNKGFCSLNNYLGIVSGLHCC